MNNIIIIGNGFDLANGFKTSYKHFFEALIGEILAAPEYYKDVVKPAGAAKDFDTYIKYNNHNTYYNKFLSLLTKDFIEKNWCDIEALYFQELSSMNNFENIHQLNEQFKRIKDELEIYLSSLPPANPGHNYFEQILSPPSIGKTLILNFNYTKTYEKYINPAKVQVINIHGELKSKENEIIFGYAATENQISEFRKLDSEYMRNVKRTNYNFTGNYKSLLQILEHPSNTYRVTILGHSCGESDQLILSQIFNNSRVELIEIVYFNKEGYFQQIVNIENLISNEIDYNKIVEYEKSLKMPQRNESEKFEELLHKYYQKRQK